MAQLEVKQPGFHRLIHAMQRGAQIKPVGSINRDRISDGSLVWRRLCAADIKGAAIVGEIYVDMCATLGRLLEVPPSEDQPLRQETLRDDGSKFVEYWAIVQYSDAANTFRTIEITGFDPTPRRVSRIKEDRYFVQTAEGEMLLRPQTVIVWEDTIEPCSAP